MLADAITFPVVLFHPDRVFYVFQRPEEEFFGFTLKSAVVKGGYRNTVLVDSNGIAYNVKDAVILGPKGPLWGYQFPFDWLVRIDFKTDEVKRQLSVAEISALVRDCVNCNAEIYSETFDSRKLLARIENAQSQAQAIELLRSAR